MRHLQTIQNEIKDAKSKTEIYRKNFEDFKHNLKVVYSDSTENSGRFLILCYFIYAVVLFLCLFFVEKDFAFSSLLGILFGLATLYAFGLIVFISVLYISKKDIPFKAARSHFAFSTASLIILLVLNVALNETFLDFNQLDFNQIEQVFSDSTFESKYLMILTVTITPFVLTIFISSMIKFIKKFVKCKHLSKNIDRWKQDLENAEYKLKKLEEELSSTEQDLEFKFKNEIQKGKVADADVIKEIADYGLKNAEEWVENHNFELKMSNKIIEVDKTLENKDYKKYAQAMKLLEDVIKDCEKKNSDLYNLAISEKSNLKSSIKTLGSHEIYVVAIKMSEYSSLEDYALELFQLAADQKDSDAIKKINACIEEAEKSMYLGKYESVIQTFEILKNAGNSEAKELWRKANDFKKQEEIADNKRRTDATREASIRAAEADLDWQHRRLIEDIEKRKKEDEDFLRLHGYERYMD